MSDKAAAGPRTDAAEQTQTNPDAPFFWTLGVLSAQRSDSFYRRMVLLGFAVGLPVIGYGVWRNFATGWGVVYSLFLGSQFNYWGSLLLSGGWIGMVMLAVTTGAVPAITRLGRKRSIGTGCASFALSRSRAACEMRSSG